MTIVLNNHRLPNPLCPQPVQVVRVQHGCGGGVQGGALSESRGELRTEWCRHRQAHGTQRVRDPTPHPDLGSIWALLWGDLVQRRS